jgi:NADH-quinone oxidoreductase subunit H
MADFLRAGNTGSRHHQCWDLLAQSMLIIAFVMISLLFLDLRRPQGLGGGTDAPRAERRGALGAAAIGLPTLLKYVVKEVVVPAGVDRPVYFLAPMISFVLAVLAWSVIPFNDGWVLSDINVAILFVFAIASLEVYGVIMGGWASNSKYAFLGSLRSRRADDQLRGVAGPDHRRRHHLDGQHELSAPSSQRSTDWGMLGWYWLPHLPMVVLFFISCLAETNRPPFDLPEAESELVAGYHGRVFLDPVSAVHGRRVHRHLADVRADQPAVLRRLAQPHSGPAGRATGCSPRWRSSSSSSRW